MRTPHQKIQEAYRRKLHQVFVEDDVLRVLDNCNPNSGEVGYAHLPGGDHLSNDYVALIACVHRGFLLWVNFRSASQTPGDNNAGTDLSVFRITASGQIFLDNLKRKRDAQCQQNRKTLLQSK